MSQETTEASEETAASDYVSDRKFADLPLSKELLQGIADLGYITATAVQAASIEPALAGRDMVVRAKTGTGKTAAFCVPVIERIEAGAKAPRAVILAPTRELAHQIADEAASLAAHKDFEVALLVGGVPIGPQTDKLEAGAALIVGTPGRVLDHIRRRNLDLSGAIASVLDEADEMLSMGFFEDVTAILDAAPKGHQVLLFSATISDDTQRLVDTYLTDPEQLILSTDADRVTGISHLIYEVQPGQHKIRTLLHILDIEDPTSAIVFCNTREDAATVAAFLDRQGFDAHLLSGELPQKRRSAVMAAVKRGEVRFLIATDVAARGIDISDLSHVINYSLPSDPAVYLHRTGRTGRIGKEGTAINLYTATSMATRNVLTHQHRIPFEVRTLPSPEECTKLRVDRQAAQIRAALGTIVFESYLPTVRELLTRDDGHVLLAAALRTFFHWDRQRRAALSSAAPSADDEAAMRDARAGKSRRGRDDDRRGSRRDGDRDRDGDRKRDRRRSEPALDLDAALAVEDAPKDSVAPDAADDAKKKKRRRRRKKKSSETDAAEATVENGAPTPAPIADDLDALLALDAPADTQVTDDLDAALAVEPPATTIGGEDLDDLLSFD